ncbi:MAG: nuclear transport factor 2 family protein [Pseudomonadota bacterium]|nr:nuclear transport factor 2 family protein [Pseudomonadota bacterium]
MAGEQSMLIRLYENFRNRDVDAMLAMMSPDVEWARDTGDGYLSGHDALRQHWHREWQDFATYLDPQSFSVTRNERTAVQVIRTVRDLQGRRLSETTLGHIFTIRDGLIVRLDIRESRAPDVA